MSGVASAQCSVDLNEGDAGHANTAASKKVHVRSIAKLGAVTSQVQPEALRTY
jgi:hypothetical protein